MKLSQNFSILFWIYRSKVTKQGLVPIYVRITIDGDRAECSTKRVIEPDAWDSDKEKVIDTHAEASIINDYIRLVYGEINRHYNMLLATQTHVTPNMVKESYLGKGKAKQEKRTFAKHFDQYIKQLEEKVKVGDLSDGRYKKLKVLRRKVLLYMEHKFKNTDIMPQDMKLNFIVGFEHFLKTVQNIGHNTASKYAKDLKQVMGYVIVEEDMPNNTFQSFKATYKKVKRKYLTEEELAAIENKVITIERLDKVRDCFVFSCYTGYAYSDVEALTQKDIVKGFDGSLWIMRYRGKTDERENVPLLPKALEIINKYKNHPYCKVHNKLLPVNSNVRYNAYLKEIAGLCGISKTLTTHVARHTCATTVLLSNDVPIETVQEFLGHSDIRTTRIYARTVQKKLSRDLNVLKDKITAGISAGNAMHLRNQ